MGMMGGVSTDRTGGGGRMWVLVRGGTGTGGGGGRGRVGQSRGLVYAQLLPPRPRNRPQLVPRVTRHAHHLILGHSQQHKIPPIIMNKGENTMGIRK